MSIGDQLKQAREQNGLSVQDVEQATKIRKKYIQAMEDNNFDILPGGTYIKGFLRNYARLVKLDSEALVQQYEIQYQSAAKTAEENDTVQGNTETKTNNKTVNWRPLAMLTALLAVAGMIYAAGIWPGQSQPNRATPPAQQLTQDNTDLNKQGHNNQPSRQDTPKDPGQSQDQVGLTPPEQKNMQVVLQVTDKECWMRILVDEQYAFEGTLQPGMAKTFQGQKSIAVRLGNAGSVKIKVNDKDYGFIGEPGQVVTKTFALADFSQNTSDS